MSITSQLFKAARVSADVRALASGDPRRIARRAKNRAIGRGMARAGVWSRLWR